MTVADCKSLPIFATCCALGTDLLCPSASIPHGIRCVVIHIHDHTNRGQRHTLLERIRLSRIKLRKSKLITFMNFAMNFLVAEVRLASHSNFGEVKNVLVEFRPQ